MTSPDAVVVGSGPNGLAAAVTLARAGLAVDVYEGADTPGGGCRTAELTLPGFRHDMCAAVHPLAAISPFFRQARGAAHGLSLMNPKVAFAHPMDGDRAVAVTGSVGETAAALGADAQRYRRLMSPLVRDAEPIARAILAPLRSVPARPVSVARFGAAGLLPMALLARGLRTEQGRAVLAGAAAHSMLPLSAPLTGAFGLLLTMLGHAVGWPVAAGGSGRVTGALVAELGCLGGHVHTGRWIHSLDELPPCRAVLLDVAPRQLITLAGGRLGGRYRAALERFRYGPGVCKADWALAGPVPWRAPVCRETATVHVGGTLAEVASSEADVAAGRHPQRPFCLVAQPTVVDGSRAPAGKHVLWAYCHVPPGSPVDMTSRIEAQIERFAPGFRDLILARVTTTAAEMARYNPNYVGGDINDGLATVRQTLIGPAARWNPYRTGLPGVYLCSAATPPGGGVHGMCGYGAARAALADVRGPSARQPL